MAKSDTSPVRWRILRDGKPLDWAGGGHGLSYRTKRDALAALPSVEQTVRQRERVLAEDGADGNGAGIQWTPEELTQIGGLADKLRANPVGEGFYDRGKDFHTRSRDEHKSDARTIASWYANAGADGKPYREWSVRLRGIAPPDACAGNGV